MADFLMEEHGDAKNAMSPFEAAVEAVLSYRETMEQRSRAPVVRWMGGVKLDDGSMHVPFPDYHIEVGRFFRAVAKFLELWTPIAKNYEAISSKYRHDNNAIGTASPDEVKALLTFLFRLEKFCDGHWESELQSGRVTALLDRLHELHRRGEIRKVEDPS